MPVHHDDVRKLRIQKKISKEWRPVNLRGLVNDNYINQTVANDSACSCGKLTGFHCKGLETDSCRFIRLGSGWYCLPGEAPDRCPIHKCSSSALLAKNPYVLRHGKGIP